MTNTGRAAHRQEPALSAELQAAQDRLLARRAAHQQQASAPQAVQITADPYQLFAGPQPIRAAQLCALLCRLADERQPQPTLRRWAADTLQELARATPAPPATLHNGFVHAALEKYLTAITHLRQEQPGLRPWQAGRSSAALIHFRTSRTTRLHLQYTAEVQWVRVAREERHPHVLRLIGDQAHLQQLSEACNLDVRPLRFYRLTGEPCAPTPHLQAPFLMTAPTHP